ncbi:putative protein kinase RLK-Pelle-LRR-III family [Helianthus annuus]|nr:putative protein kinase RLK-Pelle-LRR-III family [Helianthus annuus]
MMFPAYVVSIFLILCNSHFTFILHVTCLNDEGYTLLTFKQSITQDPEGSLTNWNYSDETPCSWNGIACKDQKVISVSIPQKKLSGFISPVLGSLSELRHVNLRSNSLGNLPEKVYIDLTYNNLTGPIPQTGALVNRGPTAFIGNTGLCGPPLKNLCEPDDASPPSSFPFLPSSDPSEAQETGRKGLSKSGVVAIIVSDVVGICLIGLILSYCYSRLCLCGGKKHGHGKGGNKRRNECLCFKKDESETLSDHIEQYDLVALDAQLGFDLDELLKASAFVLGKSGIGIVYKVVLEDGVTFAVRRLGEGGSQRFKEFQTEVEAIGKLKHPNIVTLRAYYWSVDEKLLIYDFVPNGNLGTAIHGKPGVPSFTPLSWPVRLKIMRGTAKGLAYLHEFSPKKYVHGDLKPSNILLGLNMEPQISDFGLSRLANIAGGGAPVLQSNRVVSEVATTTTTATSTSASHAPASYYQAPEAFKVVKPSQKWDVYSFGVVLLEMITGKPPVVQVGPEEMDLVHWIQLCIEEKKPLSDVLDPGLAQDADKEEEIIAVLKIAMGCTQSNPEKRPSMRHVAEVLDRLSQD